MQFYSHERKTERDQGPTNTVWPLMSTSGIDIDDCKAYLKERGLSWIMAEANGWYPSRDAMDNFLRIVIPAITTKPGHVYWQARAVSKNVYIRYQTPKGPRHGALICTAANPLRILPKSSPTVVIVEGPMDALAVSECGYDSIALMGMSPGDEALQHLLKLVNRRFAVVALDTEPLAQSKAASLVLYLASAGGKSMFSSVKGFKDLASIPYRKRQSWLSDTIHQANRGVEL